MFDLGKVGKAIEKGIDEVKEHMPKAVIVGAVGAFVVGAIGYFWKK